VHKQFQPIVHLLILKLEKNDTTIGEYVYDGDGRRLQATENSVTTTYIHDGSEIKYEENTNSTTTYIYGPTGRLARRTTINQVSNTYYYHTDHLSSTRLVTDTSKNIVAAATYHPFGTLSTIEGLERYLYTGKEKDAIGLYYYGARYYDFEAGRFITRNLFTSLPNDPRIIGGSIANISDYKNPQTFNQFSYAGNNPLRYAALPESLSWNGYDIRFNYGQWIQRTNTLKPTCCLSEESRSLLYKEVDEQNVKVRESRKRLSFNLGDLLSGALEVEDLRSLISSLIGGGDFYDESEYCAFVVRDCDGWYVSEFDNMEQAHGHRELNETSSCPHEVNWECGEIDRTRRPHEFCLGTSIITLFVGLAILIAFMRQKRKKST
jgi:RHS repeat-associated protein